MLLNEKFLIKACIILQVKNIKKYLNYIYTFFLCYYILLFGKRPKQIKL